MNNNHNNNLPLILLVTLVTATVTLLATLLITDPHPAPAPPVKAPISHDLPAAVLDPGPDYVCRYEDMLPYVLQVDGFGHQAGEVICLNIDDFVNKFQVGEVLPPIS